MPCPIPYLYLRLFLRYPALLNELCIKEIHLVLYISKWIIVYKKTREPPPPFYPTKILITKRALLCLAVKSMSCFPSIMSRYASQVKANDFSLNFNRNCGNRNSRLYALFCFGTIVVLYL